MAKHKTKSKRLWLTQAQRRELARKNIAKLRKQVGTAEWTTIFKETVSYADYK